MRKTLLPKAPLGRVLVEKGAERVSKEGLDSFSSLVDAYAEQVASKALEIAKHCGRKTIQSKDVILAKELIKS
ncbi:MAG: histone [Candidatus Woesearchaeota archaeon]